MEPVPRTSKTKPNSKKTKTTTEDILMIFHDSIDFSPFSLHFVLRGDFFGFYFIRINDTFSKAEKKHL